MRTNDTKTLRMKELKMKDKFDCVYFTEKNFQEEVINSDRPVLVVFEADWSGTFQIMAPVLNNLCKEFQGRVTIGMIDIDSDGNLSEKLGILKIPSLVFFNKGEVVDHIVGLVPKDIIAARLNDMAASTTKR